MRPGMKCYREQGLFTKRVMAMIAAEDQNRCRQSVSPDKITARLEREDTYRTAAMGKSVRIKVDDRGWHPGDVDVGRKATREGATFQMLFSLMDQMEEPDMFSTAPGEAG